MLVYLADDLVGRYMEVNHRELSLHLHALLAAGFGVRLHDSILLEAYERAARRRDVLNLLGCVE